MFELVSTAKQKAMCEEAGIEYRQWKLYFKAADGTLLCVGKPSIKSRIWYNDECPDPLGDTELSRYEGFVRENMEDWYDLRAIREWIECDADLKAGKACCGSHAFVPVLRRWDGDGAWVIDCYDRSDDLSVKQVEKAYGSREMTKEEMDALPRLAEDMEAMFTKRLNTYWKRYNDKVSSCGYWADR